MKKLLIGLAVFVVLALAAVVFLPGLIPAETYKREVSAQVEKATGRTLTIAGDARLSILPRLQLEANDVSFANASWSREGDMVKLDSLKVDLALWPLLSGEVEVRSFVLVGPEILLEVDAQGRKNWEFKTAKGGAAKPAESGGGGGGGGAGTGLSDLRLGDVRIENGRVTYRDAQSGTKEEISNVDLTLTLKGLANPFAAKGGLVWKGKRIGLDLTAAQPGALLDGKTSKIAAKVDSEPVKLSFDGSLTNSQPLKAGGKVDLNVPSIRKLAAWAAKPIKGGGNGLGPLKITGDLSLDGQTIAFRNAALAVDGMNGKGGVQLALGGARPRIDAKLALDKLDLNTYMPPQKKKAAKKDKKAKDKGPREWSREPIDVSGLKAADAKLDLSVGQILAQKLKIGKTKLGVTLENGKLAADLSEMALYKGNGSAKITVDGSKDVPAITHSLKIEGVEAKPFLTDAMDIDFLSGTANADIDVKTSGHTEYALVRGLKGDGKIKFLDGAIEGVNLGAMIRNVSTAFLDAKAGKTQKTDFAELSGSFKINKGIVHNDDLLMKAPLFRLDGKGKIRLPQQNMNYRLEPKIAATGKGQGGKKEALGVSVPVIVSGPWHDLSYKPDLAGLVGDTLKSPGKAVDKLKKLAPGGSKLKGGAEKTLKNLLGR